MSALRPVVQGRLRVSEEQGRAVLAGRALVCSVPLKALHKCETTVSGTGLWESLRGLALLAEEEGADVMLVSDAAFTTEDRIMDAWRHRGVVVAHRVQAPRSVGGVLVTLATLGDGAPGAVPPRPVESVLRDLYSLVAVRRTEAALVRVWESFDDARVAEDVRWGEELLEQMALDRVNAEVMVGALTASRLLRGSLSAARERYWMRADEALRERSTRDPSLRALLGRLRR